MDLFTLFVMIEIASSYLKNIKGTHIMVVPKGVWSAHLSYYIRFGSKLYRQSVGMQMGTNRPLVADLFLFCYERDFMLSFC